MKITKSQATVSDWDQVHCLNYKIMYGTPYGSVVYAELTGVHGEVQTEDVERIYYMLDGSGEFKVADGIIPVTQGDILTIPPHTTYNYWPKNSQLLKVLLFMELWNN